MRKTHFLACFYFLLCCFQLHGKDNYDSLNHVVYQSKRLKLKAYKSLLSRYADQNPDSVFSLSKRLLNLATDENNALGENMAYVFLGDYCSEKGNHKLAIEYLNKAKEFYISKNAYYELAEVYNLIGNVFYRKGEFLNALEWYKREIEITKNSDNDWIGNLSKLNMGRTYIRLGNNKKGEKIILSYIEDVRKLNKNKELANAYNVIGGYYQSVGDYNLSHSYFQEALQINLAEENIRNVAHSYNKLGISYFYQGKKELSKAYFIKALKIRKQIDIKKHIAESYYNLGDWFFYSELYDSATYFYQKSYDVGVSGNSYKDMGDAILALSEVEKAQHHYTKALTYYTQYTTILKKQYNKNITDESIRQFNQMIQEKKMNNMIAQAENKLSKSLNSQFKVEKWVLLTVIFLLIVAGGIVFFVLNKNKKEYTQKTANSMQVYESKLRELKSKSEKNELKLNKINTEIIESIKFPNIGIQIFCNAHIEKTRLLKISKERYFLWEAPVDLSSSILMYLYLNKRKSELNEEQNIDTILADQPIINDSKIEWMIVDEAKKIVLKSGFSHVKNKRLLSFASNDVEKNTLIVHSDFPESMMDELILMQKSIDEIGPFSDKLKTSILHQLKKGFGENNQFCVLYFV